jgi:hypothetical protein
MLAQHSSWSHQRKEKESREESAGKGANLAAYSLGFRRGVIRAVDQARQL